MTEEDWEVTCAAFVDFVDQVEPQALLVFGANLFTGLRSEPSALRHLRRLESRTAVIVHPGTIGFRSASIEPRSKVGAAAGVTTPVMGPEAFFSA